MGPQGNLCPWLGSGPTSSPAALPTELSCASVIPAGSPQLPPAPSRTQWRTPQYLKACSVNLSSDCLSLGLSIEFQRVRDGTGWPAMERGRDSGAQPRSGAPGRSSQGERGRQPQKTPYFHVHVTNIPILIGWSSNRQVISEQHTSRQMFALREADHFFLHPLKWDLLPRKAVLEFVRKRLGLK